MTRPSDDPSYDVRVWSIRVYKGRRDTTYTVRWMVASSLYQQTFSTRKLAESFRAGLITATRGGLQFSASDGLPMSMRPKQAERTWYAHACAFIDLKWTRASPSHRRGLAEARVHFRSMNAQAWEYQVRSVWLGRMEMGSPSEPENCTPPRVAVMRPARKDSVSFRVAKVRWWREPATCHLTVYVVPRLPL